MNELKFCTKDGVKIAVNHYKNGFNEVIIIAPGWFMTKDSNAFRAISEEFKKFFDLLVMDFRGHGKSSGFYTFTSKEVNDLDVVIDFASKNYNKIYLMGFSLGRALALLAGANNYLINKIIAISPPVSFEKIENQVWKKSAWLPTLKKFELNRRLSVRPSLFIRKKIKPIDIIKDIKCPTLFIAGEKDPTVCAWHTKELFDNAICKKKYELFLNCFHAEDLFLDEKEKFVSICKSWLLNE